MILLDTQVILWLAFDQAQLSQKARRQSTMPEKRATDWRSPTSACWN